MPRSFRWNWLGVLALAACPGVVLGQESSSQTHTVRKGDTLWDLARQYRADPFLWPDIYRLNTSVVEDPHWIYPGEVLRLDPTEAVASVPSTDTPVVADSALDAPVAVAEPAAPDPEAPPASLATVTRESEADHDDMEYLFGPPHSKAMEATLRAYTEQPYRPLRSSEFYSSGFLTERERLPFGKVLGPVTPPQIKAMAQNVSALPYTMMAVQAPRGATYEVGDTLLLARLGTEVERFGDAVVPTGLAQVADTADGKYLVRVVAIYGTIRAGQKVLPAEAFTPAGGERAVPVEQGITATLLGGPARQELKAPQMVVFLDKGRQDGVAPGDLFEARRRPERLPDGSIRIDEVMATMQVVHVRERTATARLLNIVSPDIVPGTEVKQVAKLP